MEAAPRAPGLKDDDRFHLEFALGKALHDLGRSDEAFCHYAAGNALRRTYHPFDRGTADPAGRSQHRAVHRRGAVARPAAAKRRTRSSSSACRARDRPWSSKSCHRTARSRARPSCPTCRSIARERGEYPASAVDLDCASSGGRRGEEYLKRAAVQRRTDRPLFIDKLPNNWMFVPFIHLVLPNAKIIDARRHPLGCCMSNFRQHFARGQDFTYDLTDLGRYYSDYVRLMAHIDAVMPGRVHRVIYERMVDDTEARGSRAARLLRTGIRAGVPRILQDRARGPHPELGAGPPADLSRRRRRMAALRGASGAAEGSARAGSRRLSGRARVLHATLAKQSCAALQTAVDKSPRALSQCRHTAEWGHSHDRPLVPRH